jgi:hypothetical protein
MLPEKRTSSARESYVYKEPWGSEIGLLVSVAAAEELKRQLDETIRAGLRPACWFC